MNWKTHWDIPPKQPTEQSYGFIWVRVIKIELGDLSDEWWVTSKPNRPNSSFFLLIFCLYCKALFVVGHWICDIVHTVYFVFWFVSRQPFLFSYILILRQEATPPLPAGRSSSPPHHWYFFSSLASLTLSLSFLDLICFYGFSLFHTL